jgi:hypothetical protein
MTLAMLTASAAFTKVSVISKPEADCSRSKMAKSYPISPQNLYPRYTGELEEGPNQNVSSAMSIF